MGGITSSSDPTLVEDANGTLHVVFASIGNGLYHSRKPINGSWSTPTKIYNASTTTYPSLIINHDTGHVAFVSYVSSGGMEAPGGTYKVYYGTFDVDISNSLSIKKQVYSSSAISILNVSLAQMSSAQLHAVWSRGNEIYHSSGSGASWSTASNISNNNGSSVNPSIATIYGNSIRVVWQDNTSGNYDILSKLYYTSWSFVENISDNTGSSINPTIMFSDYLGGVPIFVWSDNSNGNYNTWYQVYGAGSVELRSTPGTSNYPAVTERAKGDTTRFLFIWTEGSGSPYTVASSYDDGPIYSPRMVFREETDETPMEFSLGVNYPNPFNPTTLIQYVLPGAGPAKLIIYDILGQEVAILVDEFKSAGTHEVIFDARNFPSGIYFYQIRAGFHSAIKKMVLIK